MGTINENFCCNPPNFASILSLFLFFSHPNSDDKYRLNLNYVNRKKCRWCAWDLNTGPLDGKR